MAGAVAVVVSTLAHDGACGVVDVSRCSSRAHPVQAGSIRRFHNLVDLDHLRGRLTERERPGHIRVITVHGRAEVHLDHVAPSQGAPARIVVGLGGLLAEARDRVERHSLRAALSHLELEERSELDLGHPFFELVQHSRQRVVGHVVRAAHRSDLAFVFDRAQVLHLIEGLDEPDARHRVADPAGHLKRHVPGFHAEATDVHPAHHGHECPVYPGGLTDGSGAHGIDLTAHVGDLVRGLLFVPPIRHEHVLTTDDQLAVRARVAGEVSDVHRLRDEQRVDSQGLEPRTDPLPAFVHLASTAASSAKRYPVMPSPMIEPRATGEINECRRYGSRA